MSTILDQAEARITDTKTQAHTTRAQIIDAMRDEIARQHYQQAKAQLPEIERAIQKTYRPFLNQVATIAANAKTVLPAQVQGWVR